jgi:hypothetical protein
MEKFTEEFIALTTTAIFGQLETALVEAGHDLTGRAEAVVDELWKQIVDFVAKEKAEGNAVY